MDRPFRAPARAAIKATIGRRQQQQDTARQTVIRTEAEREALLVIVADGMGGAVGGQIASSRAVEAFAAHAAASAAPIAERLRDALDAANAAIAAAVAANARLTGMGTTLVAAVIDGPRLDWISVGDSLLLSIEGRQAQRLNADHSVGGMLDEQAKRGEIGVAEAATSDQRHLLRSVLLGEPIAMINAGSTVVGETARLVVASDGVLTLGFGRLADLVGGAASLDIAAGKVVEAIEALALDDQDNMTIAVAMPGRAAAAVPEARAVAGGDTPPQVPEPAAAQPASRRLLPTVALLVGVLALAGTAAWLLPWPGGSSVIDRPRRVSLASQHPAPAQPLAPAQGPVQAPAQSQAQARAEIAPPLPAVEDGRRPSAPGGTHNSATERADGDEPRGKRADKPAPPKPKPPRAEAAADKIAPAPQQPAPASAAEPSAPVPVVPAAKNKPAEAAPSLKPSE